MLAQKYDDHRVKLDFTLGVFSQPKLDGIRAVISAKGAFSREFQPHNNVDHILEALAPAFGMYPDIVFDGELYNHDFKDDFGKIASSVRKQNPTDAQKVLARAHIQYHIYDLCDDNLTFRDRASKIQDTVHEDMGCPPCIVPVVTAEVTSFQRLDEIYGGYLADGYEGQMVRTNAPYEFDKRSKSLLKRKEFITAEYPLVRIEEGQGNWAGYAKKAVFELADGRECGAGIRGDQRYTKALLAGWQRRGTITVRHFALTPDGMPRFPVMLDWQPNGRKD